MVGTLADRQTFLRRLPAAPPRHLALALEVAALLAAPAVLYFALRLRGMAPPQLPDPGMHTTFIVAPHDIFTRYQAAFTPTARLREAARVGFLVPARLSYLLFGALPGFFVFRYVLALVTTVPAYLLGRRLYGRWAGWLAVVVLMSSPVLVTAWGTDYPDSAAVSYLVGGLSALALSWRDERRRLGWLLAAAALLTLAVWSHAIAVPLAGVAIAVYVLLRLARERPRLARDVAMLVGVAVAVTGALAVGSKLLIGQLDFVTPTIRAEQFLSTPAQEALWHSSGWGWAPYDPYLLVPPAVAAAFEAVFARRRQRIGIPQLLVGLTGALQLALLAYLQFFGSVQGLEMHFLSSALWAAVNLMLVLVLAEIAAPLVAGRPGHRRLARAAPAVLVLVVGLIYATLRPHVPAMTWAPWGAVLALIIVVGALLGRQTLVAIRTAAVLPLSAGAVVVVTGAVLVLTVAPREAHGRLAGTVADPPPAYATALGGGDASYVDQYVVAARLPAFVGHPAYRGEQLLTWWPWYDATAVVDSMGIYHSAFNAVSFTFPRLGHVGERKIETRHAAQVLLMSMTSRSFDRAVRSLSRFGPTVVKRGVLSDGSYHLHLWLVDLARYLHPPASRTASDPDRPAASAA